MIGALEIAQAQLIAAQAAERSAHTALDAGAPRGETEPGVAEDVAREEEKS